MMIRQWLVNCYNLPRLIHDGRLVLKYRGNYTTLHSTWWNIPNHGWLLYIILSCRARETHRKRSKISRKAVRSMIRYWNLWPMNHDIMVTLDPQRISRKTIFTRNSHFQDTSDTVPQIMISGKNLCGKAPKRFLSETSSTWQRAKKPLKYLNPFVSILICGYRCAWIARPKKTVPVLQDQSWMSTVSYQALMILAGSEWLTTLGCFVWDQWRIQGLFWIVPRRSSQT